MIAAIYVTYLEYPLYNRWVWLYDANIDYVSSKHIPLLMMSLFVFFFLFFPYTLLLLVGQWVQAKSHLRVFSWVNNTRLNAFMESYHNPHKAKHHYWPGYTCTVCEMWVSRQLGRLFSQWHMRNGSEEMIELVSSLSMFQKLDPSYESLGQSVCSDLLHHHIGDWPRLS